MPYIQRFRDLDLDFVANPNTGDLNVLKDDVAITRALKNLLFTNHYERPFNADFGGDIYRMLFDPLDPIIALDLKQIIKDAITTYEPRVQIVRLAVDPRAERNGYYVNLTYFIINSPVERRLDFLLERLR